MTKTAIPYAYDDGGRIDAGYKGYTRDCVVRAIAIATTQPYDVVYRDLHRRSVSNRPLMASLELRYGTQASRHASPRNGSHRRIYEPYLAELGWKWTPTTGIGQGCRVHLRADELPSGRLIVRLSRHVAAVINGVLHDNHDCSHGGTRMVYGYYSKEDE